MVRHRLKSITSVRNARGSSGTTRDEPRGVTAEDPLEMIDIRVMTMFHRPCLVCGEMIPPSMMQAVFEKFNRHGIWDYRLKGVVHLTCRYICKE